MERGRNSRAVGSTIASQQESPGFDLWVDQGAFLWRVRVLVYSWCSGFLLHSKDMELGQLKFALQ